MTENLEQLSTSKESKRPTELPFTVLTEGRFPKGSVKINLGPNKISLPEKVQEFAERMWKKAKKTSPHLFNGELVAFTGFKEINGGVFFDAVPTDFKTYFGVRKAREAGLTDVEIPVLCVSGVVLTADNAVLLAQRGSKTTDPGTLINAPAGFIDLDDREGDTTDPFRSFQRELKEEIGLGVDELDEYYCMGVVNDNHIGYPAIVILAKTRLTTSEILKKETDEELTLIPVANEPKKFINSVLRYINIMEPGDFGALYLFVRNIYGDIWGDYFQSRILKRVTVYQSMSNKTSKILKERKIHNLTKRVGLTKD